MNGTGGGTSSIPAAPRSGALELFASPPSQGVDWAAAINSAAATNLVPEESKQTATAAPTSGNAFSFSDLVDKPASASELFSTSVSAKMGNANRIEAFSAPAPAPSNPVAALNTFLAPALCEPTPSTPMEAGTTIAAPAPFGIPIASSNPTSAAVSEQAPANSAAAFNTFLTPAEHYPAATTVAAGSTAEQHFSTTVVAAESTAIDDAVAAAPRASSPCGSDEVLDDVPLSPDKQPLECLAPSASLNPAIELFPPPVNPTAAAPTEPSADSLFAAIGMPPPPFSSKRK
jgi:hypothetical protein